MKVIQCATLIMMTEAETRVSEGLRCGVRGERGVGGGGGIPIARLPPPEQFMS